MSHSVRSKASSPATRRAVALLLVGVSAFAAAQTPPRVAGAVDPDRLQPVPGSRHPLATPDRDRGRVDPALPLQRMILVLARSDAQSADLRELVAAQKKTASPAFHLGLTPQQFAARFGPADADLAAVTSWLALRGLRIDAVANGRQWIEFSGTVAQVEQAFHTQMHRYAFGGGERIANASEISIPPALAPVVAGVLSLNGFEKHALHGRVEKIERNAATRQLVQGDFTTGSGNHHLVPGDFATLYHSAPLLAAGTDGSGVGIAIPGRTTIQLADVQAFRQIFGLPPNDPLVINNGAPPPVFQNDEYESDLDVQWAGAVAPNASIKFVTSSSTFVTDGIDLSNAYIVDNKVAPIMSVSYGLCEAFLGDAGNAFYASLYQQAAVEGISVFVASGDNGAAGCDAPEGFAPAQNGLAVNGLASTPYNLAVGGTQFDEGGNEATYWSATNNADLSSALGYIPETVWNETCDPTITPDRCSDYNLWSGSGGASAIYAKPSWQTGSGVPNDGARDLPDVSLTAAGGHDGYLICSEGSCVTHVDNGVTILDSATVIGGTSASAPAMAGIMALVEQKNGSWLGLANDDFYQLAASDKLAKCDSSKILDPAAATACVFHDVTAGDNSVPGQAGFDARRGYDQASGLGTVDAANLVANWNATPPRATVTTLAGPAPAPLGIVHGQPYPLTVTVAPASGTGTPSGFFALETDGYGSFVGGALNSGQFAGGVSNLPGGSYNLTAHYGGDTVFAGSDSNAIALSILPEDSTLSVGCITLNFAGFVVDCFGFENYGQPTALTFTVSGLSGQGAATGSIVLQLDGVPVATLPVHNGVAGIEVDDLPASTGLLPGDHVFAASYSGDNSFNPSSATPYSTTIYSTEAFSSVTTVDDAGVAEVNAGVALPLVVTVGGPGVLYPGGSVQLVDKDSGELVGPVLTLDANGQAATSITLTVPGVYDICANYSGDAVFNEIDCQFTHGNAAGITITVDVPPDPIFASGFDVP